MADHRAGTEHQRAVGRKVFDVALLGTRLVAVTHWLAGLHETRMLELAYFGASTGAAAALWAAADASIEVSSLVSRGGRPDLTGPRLASVRAPTLLIVGSKDEVVEKVNHQAAAHMNAETRVELVAGATHLFEEPGSLAAVAKLARAWFVGHLVRSPGGHRRRVGRGA